MSLKGKVKYDYNSLMSLFLGISCSRTHRWRDGSMERLTMTSHGLVYPIDVLADLGINTRVIGLTARESSPGHQALQSTSAHQRSA